MTPKLNKLKLSNQMIGVHFKVANKDFMCVNVYKRL